MWVKASNRGGVVHVSDDGEGLASRAGLGLVSAVADTIGLTDGLSQAADGVVDWRAHDPGVVLRNLVLTLADGGTALRHTQVLYGQQPLFGRVASTATTCRTIDSVAGDEQAMDAIAAARKTARRYVWAADEAPPAVVAAAADDDVDGPDEPLVIDVDATLIEAGSEDKDGAGANYKGGFGFQPILACLDRGDGTGEALAAMLREGNRTANTAADNVAIIDAALDQLPALPESVRLVIRGDSALATHAVADACRDRDLAFSVSYDLSPAVRDAIRAVDETAWTPAERQDGEARHGAGVVELSDDVDLSRWPSGTRLIVRREPLHPGAQQTFDDIDGHRFTAMLTDQTGDEVTIECRHRARARIEDRIRIAKDTGMRKLPCETFERNRLWLQLVLAAVDLLVFTQLLTLDGNLRIAEPKTIRYRLLHVAAKFTFSQRQTRMHLDRDWPWATQLLNAFKRLGRLPQPAT